MLKMLNASHRWELSLEDSQQVDVPPLLRSMMIVYVYFVEAALDAAFKGRNIPAAALSAAIAAVDAALLVARCLRVERLG